MTDRMRIKVEENTEKDEEMRHAEKECRRNKGTEKEREKIHIAIR
jgi:hypothetical protein